MSEENPPVFSIGRNTPRMQMPRRHRISLVGPLRTNSRPIYISSPSQELPILFANPPSPKWFLIPKHHVKNTAVYEAISGVVGYGIWTFFRSYTQEALKRSPFASTPQFTFDGAPKSDFLSRTPKFLREYKDLLYKNQRVRWAMKRLVRMWLGRRLKAANTEDLVTMEAPKQPVIVYDWSARCKYVFEATSILRDIRERLCYSEYLFPSAQLPRNPYTNQPLSMMQYIHCVEQLLGYRLTDWALSAYLEQRLNLNTFQTVHNLALKLRACKMMFAHESGDFVDMLYDFIDEEYEHHGYTLTNSKIWLWAIENDSKSSRIQKWKRLCMEYYTQIYTRPEQFHPGIVRDTHEKSLDLVHIPTQDLVARWRAANPGAAVVNSQ